MPDSDVDKGLDQFNKALDKYLAIKEKIEKAFAIQNRNAIIEDRALQIRLAQLNSDLQIYLAGIFGFFAGGVTFTVFAIQLFINQPPAFTINTFLFFVAAITSLIAYYGVVKLLRKLDTCYKEIKNLH